MVGNLQPEEITEILVILSFTLALAWPLGMYLAELFKNQSKLYGILSFKFVDKVFLGSAPLEQMNWFNYLKAFFLFHLVGFITLFFILVFQGYLPLNPANIAGMNWDLAFNTAISFVTNTNWQAYSGEAQLSYLSQMLGLCVQNFVSAASGICIVAAVARGLSAKQRNQLGNFWQDLVRVTICFLIPLSIVLAFVLMSQGVVQNFNSYQEIRTLEGLRQIIPGGPAASQVAIKQLGTNGGGFFGVNSAHPFENPTPLSNFLQIVSILLIPISCVFAFGKLIKRKAHGRAILLSMFLIFLPLLGMSLWAEAQHNPAIKGVGSFMEGKEVRHGIGSSTLWSVATTAASNGSVNSMHDSFSPLGGFVAVFNILLGEVVFGGVGAGLYGMLLFVVLAVFLAGLMVGRSPEYLGKKLEKQEVVLASIGIMTPCFLILIGAALALLFPAGFEARSNLGPHGLTEVLYGMASAAGNNGSAFAGLGADSLFYNLILGTWMCLGRFVPIYCIVRIAGTLATKKSTADSLGTFPTHGFSFIALLIGVVLIVGALTFFPVLALGPLSEHAFMLQGKLF